MHDTLVWHDLDLVLGCTGLNDSNSGESNEKQWNMKWELGLPRSYIRFHAVVGYSILCYTIAR